MRGAYSLASVTTHNHHSRLTTVCMGDHELRIVFGKGGDKEEAIVVADTFISHFVRLS